MGVRRGKWIGVVGTMWFGYLDKMGWRAWVRGVQYTGK